MRLVGEHVTFEGSAGMAPPGSEGSVRARQLRAAREPVGRHGAVMRLLECQPPFRCGLAQAVHGGVALGIGGSNVHQAAL
jgi:hypothetical protein